MSFPFQFSLVSISFIFSLVFFFLFFSFGVVVFLHLVVHDSSLSIPSEESFFIPGDPVYIQMAQILMGLSRNNTAVTALLLAGSGAAMKVSSSVSFSDHWLETAAGRY